MKIQLLPKGLILLALGGYKKHPFSSFLARKIQKHLYEYMERNSLAIVPDKENKRITFAQMNTND